MAGLSDEGFDFEGADDFSLLSPTPFISSLSVKRVFLMIDHYQCQHVDLISWFPCVVAIWVTLPFDEVLKMPFVSVKMVINDGLNLVFFCIFD